MNKKLIQELLDDPETRLEIASLFGFKMEGDDCHRSSWDYDDIMVETLNDASYTPVVGDVITIEVSNHMWVRGEYICTEPDGRLLVSIPGKTPVPALPTKKYTQASASIWSLKYQKWEVASLTW